MYIGSGASKHSIEKATKKATTLKGVLDRDYGKIAKGTDVTGMTIKDLISQAYIGEIAVTTSLSAIYGVFEKGQELADVVMDVTITKGTSDVTKIVFTVNDDAREVINNPTETSYSYDVGDISSNTVLRVYADDENYTNQPSNSKVIKFVYPWYVGVGPQGLNDISSLDKHVTTPFSRYKHSFTTDGEVFYLAFPATNTDLTSVLDANAFETIGDWEKRTLNVRCLDGTDQDYTVYEFKNKTTTTAEYTFKR